MVNHAKYVAFTHSSQLTTHKLKCHILLNIALSTETITLKGF